MLLELSVVEQRYRAVMEVVADGLTVTEVAERYGVSRQIVHRWIRRYEDAGLKGLADRSHRPKSCGHQMTAEVEARICTMRGAHPGWGPVRLRHELERAGVDPVPGRTSIYRALVRNALIEPRPRRRKRDDYRRWQREFPMELWQSDLMVVTLKDGSKQWLLTVVDDHSRFCIAAKILPKATSRAVCSVFVDALATYGIPDQVLTDNGIQFTGRLGPRPAEVMFDRMCRQNGIEHLLTAIATPTTTGKIERFHRTLRNELLKDHSFDTVEQAQQVIDVFVLDYNCNRPHQSLDMKTPNECFTPGTRTKVRKSRPRKLPAKPRPREMEISRRVSSGGQIAVADQQFSVGCNLAGKVVTVEAHTRTFEVFFEGELIRSVPRKSSKEVTRFKANRASYQQAAK